MSYKATDIIWGKDVTGNEQILLLALTSFSDEHGYEIWPSVARMTWMTALSERTIQRTLSGLRSTGYLVIVKASTRSMPTKYRINFDAIPNKPPFVIARGECNAPTTGVPNPEVTGAKSELTGAKKGLTGATQVTPYPSEEQSEEQTKEQAASAKAENLSISFGEFWKAYPRKTAKGEAEKAFNKAFSRDFNKIEDAIKGIEAYKKTEQWKQGFIPHPATYLNQKRWEDDLSHEQTRKTTPAFRNQRVEGTLNENVSSQYAGIGRVH